MSLLIAVSYIPWLLPTFENVSLNDVSIFISRKDFWDCAWRVFLEYLVSVFIIHWIPIHLTLCKVLYRGAEDPVGKDMVPVPVELDIDFIIQSLLGSLYFYLLIFIVTPVKSLMSGSSFPLFFFSFWKLYGFFSVKYRVLLFNIPLGHSEPLSILKSVFSLITIVSYFFPSVLWVDSRWILVLGIPISHFP